MAEARTRALVTGATGFVGGHLVRRLARDDWDVHAVVRRASDDPLVRPVAAAASVHQHDGSTDGLAAIVKRAAPAVVFHLASRFVAEHQAADVEPLVRANVVFGAQLLDAMRSAGVTRIVNAGSAWQHYGNREYSPVSLHAATKQAFVDLLVYYVEARAFRAVTLELTETYGPGDRRQKLIPIMLDAEQSGRELSMVRGETPLDFVHVNDAVEAFVLAARRLLAPGEPRHEVFAVRSAAPVAARDLFAFWAKARGIPVRARWDDRALRARVVLEPWTQGTVLPGWTPRVSLDEGLRSL